MIIRSFLLLLFSSSLYAQESWINVFIHGSTKVQWALCSLPKVLMDKLDDDATYSKAVRMVRHNNVFNTVNIMQELGLHPIAPLTDLSPVAEDQKAKLGPQVLTRLYDQVTRLNYPNSSQRYYTFGWSGLCSDRFRYKEAKLLYTQLTREVTRIKQLTKITPRIRLHGFSHGGNIILNLAAVQAQEQLPALQIDEAILMGMPVLPDTAGLVAHTTFKQIYHFYSPDDAVQGSDFLSFKRWGSAQTIKKQPSNVTQIKIKLVRYVDGTERKRPMSPGHIELWHLGWADWYRPSFPMYPIPILTLTPQLISILQRHPELGNKVSITLHPQRGFITARGKTISSLRINFIPRETIEEMKATALAYKPPREHFKKTLGHSYDALSFARTSRNGGAIMSKKENSTRYRRSNNPTCLD
jgi:hypothetical protein